MPRAALASLLLLSGLAASPPPAPVAPPAPDDFTYTLTDAQYYEMPRLFHLDDYQGCLAQDQLYCLGSFELLPASPAALPLYRRMQRYSGNWVDHFNHTRLHRGLCVSERCPEGAGAGGGGDEGRWFAACVNSSVAARHGLAARPLRVEYCRRGAAPAPPARPAPAAADRALAALVATLLALTALSTTLDLTLNDHSKKGISWALAWSLRGSWRTLTAESRGAEQLRIFDGVRVVCMMCVIIEHVAWLHTLGYVADPRFIELKRRDPDVMLLTNSTLVVQLFFLMSSFLLADKLLRGHARGAAPPGLGTFGRTMLHRVIRISPSYWAVVWWAGGWWARLADGPLWTPLVEAESAVCRAKWWTHLLYVNNLVYPDDKCLIQTWYLAADMQLYCVSLLLTLALLRTRHAAAVLAALLAVTLATLFALAWLWRLLPTFVMHRPENVQAAYSGDASFNVLYQAPLGNAPGALCGLLLAHAHHALGARAPPAALRWAALVSFPLGCVWAGGAPLLLGGGAPGRLGAAALAALERPVFAALMATALLGAMHGVRSPWRSVLSWRGWAVWSRLSFAALLLHMPLNKTLLASRLQPSQLHRTTAVFEWAGVACVSYLAAVPLTLLVELPAQRLLLALTARAPPPPPPPAAALSPPPAPAGTKSLQ